MTDDEGAGLKSRLIHISARKKAVAACVAMLAALARGRNRMRSGPPQKDPRVLVLEPFGLGDLISFEPLVRCLKEQGREVVLCAKPEWRRLFPDAVGQTWVDSILPWATHNELAKYRFSSYFKPPWRQSVWRLRQAALGSVGIDTRGDIRSVLLLQWVGCARVLSLSRYLGSNLTVWKRAAELVPFSSRVRRWELNLSFLEPIGLRPASKSVSGPFLAHLAPQSRPAGRSVGLMPVAPWRGKLWLPERWRQLICQLRRSGKEVRAYCGPGQRELAQNHVGVDTEIIECGSVETWAQQLANCALIVTLDSGPMHLADALGVPVIALFGQGWLPFWAPSGQHSRVIAHQDDPGFAVCHPIDENAAIGQKYMSLIGVEEVLAAVNDTCRALETRSPMSYAQAPTA